jgi:hypothetical protein
MLPKSLFVSIAIALLVCEAGFFLISDRESLRAKPDQGTTTEMAAARGRCPNPADRPQAQDRA